jgi:hypothetical protein
VAELSQVHESSARPAGTRLRPGRLRAVRAILIQGFDGLIRDCSMFHGTDRAERG